MLINQFETKCKLKKKKKTFFLFSINQLIDSQFLY